MRTLFKRHRMAPSGAARALLAFALAFASDAPASGTSAVSDSSESEDPWTSMEEALRILWTGDPAQKLDIVEDTYIHFHPLFANHPDHDDEDVTRVLASLGSFLRSERDDFISYRLLRELADQDEEILTPLFLQALRSPSPNLKWCGYRWFADRKNSEALPDLEDAWRHEERPWAKADLMIALARQGSRDDSEDFLALARGRDAALAGVAIRALTMIGDPPVIPFLAKIVRSSRSNAGLLALDALARWPESREALDAALEASRSPHVDFQRNAARALGHFADPAALDRTYELATNHVDPYVRAAALGSLAGQKDVDRVALTSLAMRLLRESPTEENQPTQAAAIATLRKMDDPSVLPELASVEFRPGDSRFFELRWLKRYLGRTREESPSGGGPAETGESSDSDDVVLDAEYTEAFTIVPPPSTITVRCWEFPEVPGDPDDFPRLPAGTEAEVVDHFERDHESWVQIDENDCWVPLRFAGTPSAERTSKQKIQEENMLIRREFDVPVVEVESDVAQGLMDAGLLDVIEPGDEVIGVAITIDPGDLDRILLLAMSCGLNETILDGEIYDLVVDLAPLYKGHPALERFRKAHQPRAGETDEVIDPDLQELTDR